MKHTGGFFEYVSRGGVSIGVTAAMKTPSVQRVVSVLLAGFALGVVPLRPAVRMQRRSQCHLQLHRALLTPDPIDGGDSDPGPAALPTIAVQGLARFQRVLPRVALHRGRRVFVPVVIRRLKIPPSQPNDPFPPL